MRCHVIAAITALCVAIPAWAVDGNIGLYFDPAGGSCSMDIPCRCSGRLYVYGLLQGASTNGITGAEYKIAVGPNSNTFFQCPMFVLCDAPVFTKVCLGSNLTVCRNPEPPFPNNATCSTSGLGWINPAPTPPLLPELRAGGRELHDRGQEHGVVARQVALP